MSLNGYIATLLRQKGLTLANATVRAAIDAHGVDPWFAYIHRDRACRWDCWMTAFWLARKLPLSARILEPGCGCGLNLMWLFERGYKSLFGFDPNLKVIAAGQQINSSVGASITLWADDGLNPLKLPGGSFDAILNLNWTYHVPEFRLEAFLPIYSDILRRNGVLVVDIIDKAYDAVANNQYLTSDWHKPEVERTPSEYRVRYRPSEVAAIAFNAGFTVETRLSRVQTVPKHVFVLRRR